MGSGAFGAFKLPPELLGQAGSVHASQYGGEPRPHNVGPPEDRDYREVSVSSTGAVHQQGSSDGERGDDELLWVEPAALVRSEELGLPEDGGDQWGDEP